MAAPHRAVLPLIRDWLRRHHVQPADADDLTQEVLTAVVRCLLPAPRRIAYRIPQRSPTPLFLRLLHYPTAGKLRSIAMHYPKPPLHEGEGTLRFEFGGLDPELTRFDEVVVVFVDLATRVDGQTVVVSNTLAALVRASPARPR